MFSPEWVAIVPFLIVGVVWVLIDDEEFDRQYKDWVKKNEEEK